MIDISLIYCKRWILTLTQRCNCNYFYFCRVDQLLVLSRSCIMQHYFVLTQTVVWHWILRCCRHLNCKISDRRTLPRPSDASRNENVSRRKTKILRSSKIKRSLRPNWPNFCSNLRRRPKEKGLCVWISHDDTSFCGATLNSNGGKRSPYNWSTGCSHIPIPLWRWNFADCFVVKPRYHNFYALLSKNKQLFA